MKWIGPYVVLSIIGTAFHLLWASCVSLDSVNSDSFFYLDMATNLREFSVYGEGETQTYYRAPLYSVFLWATSYLPGDWHTSSIVVQHVLTIGVTLFSYGRLRLWNPRVAFIWAALWLSSPFAAFNDTLILQESLYTNIIMLVAVVTFSAMPRMTIWEIVAVAFLLASVALVRDAYLLLPLAFAAAIIWATKFVAWKEVLLMLAVFVVAVTPWMARNASIEGGGFFLSKGIGGMSLFIGTWQRDANWQNLWARGINLPDHAFDNEEERERLTVAMQRRDDDALRLEAVSRIMERPLETASIWVKRSKAMWIGTRSELVPLVFDRGSFTWILFKRALWGINAMVILIGFCGLVLFGFRSTPLLIFSSIIGYVYFIYLPFYNLETRYSTPALVWLYLFAALFGSGLLDVWKQRSLAVLLSRPTSPHDRGVT